MGWFCKTHLSLPRHKQKVFSVAWTCTPLRLLSSKKCKIESVVLWFSEASWWFFLFYYELNSARCSFIHFSSVFVCVWEHGETYHYSLLTYALSVYFFTWSSCTDWIDLVLTPYTPRSLYYTEALMVSLTLDKSVCQMSGYKCKFLQCVFPPNLNPSCSCVQSQTTGTFILFTCWFC